jgi:hypothetical protein
MYRPRIVEAVPSPVHPIVQELFRPSLDFGNSWGNSKCEKLQKTHQS